MAGLAKTQFFTTNLPRFGGEVHQGSRCCSKALRAYPTNQHCEKIYPPDFAGNSRFVPNPKVNGKPCPVLRKSPQKKLKEILKNSEFPECGQG